MTNTTSAMSSYDGNITMPLVKTLTFFLDNPNKQFTGSEVMKATKLQSGTIYPMLTRLAKSEWLSVEWEKMDPLKDRQPRRLYNLSGNGRKKALTVIAEELSPTVANSFNKLIPA